MLQYKQLQIQIKSRQANIKQAYCRGEALLTFMTRVHRHKEGFGFERATV